MRQASSASAGDHVQRIIALAICSVLTTLPVATQASRQDTRGGPLRSSVFRTGSVTGTESRGERSCQGRSGLLRRDSLL
jgi:hypothetical protein